MVLKDLIRCPHCNSPLAMTAEVRVYRCACCGREYTQVTGCAGTVAIAGGGITNVGSGDSFEFVEGRHVPLAVADLRRL